MKSSNLVWEDLQLDGLKILQSKSGYRFTSDAVILANFVKCKKTDVMVEFCAGSGVISTLVCHKESPKHIYAFEVQKNVAMRAAETVKQNQHEHKITIVNKSNSNWKEVIAPESADILVCNPPYQKAGSGKVSENKEIAISKSELKTTLSQVILNARQVLKHGGTFYICIQPKRLVELFAELEKQGFGVNSLFSSYSSLSSLGSCAFVKAVKGKKQETKVLPPLITHNSQGDYITTVKTLFK